jgi:O-antigen ligase
MLLEWRLSWVNCPIAFCIAALFLLGVWQTASLPKGILPLVSPGTAILDEELLPSTPDRLAGGEIVRPWLLAAGSSISIYPAGSRAVALHILAVLALYAVVRSNGAGLGGLQRLAAVCLVNGFLLSLVGLLQYFSSPSGMVYWFLQTEAGVFGPLNRNDFACYNNLCIGLGLGMLLAEVRRAGHQERHDWPARSKVGRGTSLLTSAWIGAALAVMLVAQAFSLSRGGMLSLVLAVVICLLLSIGVGVRLSLKGLALPALVLVCVALGMIAWFGMDRVLARLATLGTNEVLESGRWEMWQSTLPWVKQFPVWGAGYGTFPYLEQMRRETNPGTDFVWDHAHSNYLEMLLEGGCVGLSIGLVAIGLVYRTGVRALLSKEGPSAGPLAFGALIGFTTLVLHSFVDFGLYLPATVALATVVCAHLSGMACDPPARLSPPKQAGNAIRRTCGCILGACFALTVAYVLCHEARADWLANRYRGAARVSEKPLDEQEQIRRISYLEAATAVRPDDAALELDLADAYYEMYSLSSSDAETRRRLVAATQLVATSADPGAPGSLPVGLVARLAGQETVSLFQAEQQRTDEQALSTRYLVPALRCYLLVRGLCPLIDRTHVRLAAYATVLEHTDPVGVHLQRARSVVPYKAQIWYLSGLHSLEAENTIDAKEKWRKSLQCSTEYLEPIVSHCGKKLSAGDLANGVLPGDPFVISRAAAILKERQDCTLLWEKAVQLLQQPSFAHTLDSRHLLAELLVRLHQTERSMQIYEELLSDSRSRPEWRFEYARLLCEQGKLDQSRRQLILLLDTTPGNADARDFYNHVIQRIAEGK